MWKTNEIPVGIVRHESIGAFRIELRKRPLGTFVLLVYEGEIERERRGYATSSEANRSYRDKCRTLEKRRASL